MESGTDTGGRKFQAKSLGGRTRARTGSEWIGAILGVVFTGRGKREGKREKTIFRWPNGSPEWTVTNPALLLGKIDNRNRANLCATEREKKVICSKNRKLGFLFLFRDDRQKNHWQENRNDFFCTNDAQIRSRIRSEIVSRLLEGTKWVCRPRYLKFVRIFFSNITSRFFENFFGNGSVLI